MDGMEEKLVLKLEEPFVFDGEQISRICMDGLLDMTARDMCDIDRQMMIKGFNGGGLEVTRPYSMLVAAKVNQKPWEFCDNMKCRDSIRLNRMVTAFFFARA